ncbi:M15 family metallopeptidase [Candidatus Saccharibacteria bacterium]|nr:M15 family metallopeptidase [Candidatus Saccharibacteria bacterium]
MREFLVALTILLGLAGCSMSLEETDAAQKSVYLVLVNKTNALPDGWESYVQLDTVRNSFSEEVRIEHKTYKQYLRLRDELFKQGVQIELDSVYRSVAEQQEIWDAWSNDPELGEEYCKKYLAVPGYSEHHTGLAVDIFILKDDEEIRDNDDMIADTEDFAKIHALLPKYGFILRYPEGKEDITGYAYEPWHLRYVGKKVAREITERGITLEEYLEK